MIPNPGSKEAKDLGCTCPVLDNEYGKGAYTDKTGKPVFWITSDCPLHGLEVDDSSN
jgi:hypothetical protein